MSVHVDELTTEVETETGGVVASGEGSMHPGGGVSWKEVARVREALAEATRHRLRTAAEGYDD
jgi:hypothetical protein